MAQTRYDPDGAYLYAKALREQGTNPIVSWFTDSQGGGLNNWIQDQGNQIATRTRNDILRELTDDPMMLERARIAQNEGRNFRKELLGNKYFVNPHDAVLNAGIDNVKTKNENRLRKQFSEALAESLNADKYKADGTTAEALAESLGYKNLSPEMLFELKEGEQSALKKRYENQIYRDIAQKRLESPNATVDDIIGNYRDRYGLNLNPDTYLDPENETMQKFIKSGANELTNNLLTSEISARSRLEALNRLRAMHPELAQELTYGIDSAKDMYNKQLLSVYTDVLNRYRDEAKKEGLGDDVARENAAGFMQRVHNVDPDTILKLQQTILGIQKGNDPTALSNANYDSAKIQLDYVKTSLGDTYKIFTDDGILHGDLKKNPEFKSTENINKLTGNGLSPKDIDRFYNYLNSNENTKGYLSSDGFKLLMHDESTLKDLIRNFNDTKIVIQNANKAFKEAEARHTQLREQSFGVRR